MILLLLACAEPGPLSALGEGYANLALEDASFALYIHIAAASLGAEACVARKQGDSALEEHSYTGVGSRLLEGMEITYLASGEGSIEASYQGKLQGEAGVLSLDLDTSGSLPFVWDGAHGAEGSYIIGRCELETGAKFSGGGTVAADADKDDQVKILAKAPLLLLGGEVMQGRIEWSNSDTTVSLSEAAEALSDQGWLGTAAGADWLGEVLLPMP